MIGASWPMIINGYSTGCPPIQVSRSRSATRIQYIVCVNGLKIIAWCLDVCRRGRIARIKIDNIKASIPPNL